MKIDELKLFETWKWCKLSPYSVKLTDAVKCGICPNECILKEGKISLCRTKVNYKGDLYSVAYGNPCSINIDPIEKKPLYHFYPGERIFSLSTAGCNFHCYNCQNWQISQNSPFQTDNYDLMPEAVVEKVISCKSQLIAYTYTDPIAFYEYAYDTAKLAKSNSLKNVLISNGYINENPLRDICKYINAANIDFKCFNDSTYKRLNGGSLKPVLNALKILKEEGVWLEITNLIIPGYNDNIDEIKMMCDWLVENGFSETPLHFSRFFPQYKLNNIPATPIETLKKAKEIAINAGIKFVYIGNIQSSEDDYTFCPKCKKLLIKREGYFVSENNIIKGKCKYCGAKILGVWE